MKIKFKKMSKQFISAAVIGLLMTPAFADDIEIYVGNEGVGVEVKPNLVFIIDTSGSMSADVKTPLPYDVNIDYAAVYGSDQACFDTTQIYFSTGDTPTSCSTVDHFNVSALKCDAASRPMFNTVAPTVVVDAPILISDVTTTTVADDIEGENIQNISSVYTKATDETVAVDEITVVTITGTNTRTVITQVTTTTTGPALASGWYQDRIAQWHENADSTREKWDAINNAQDGWLIECKADSGVHGEVATGAHHYITNSTAGPYTNSEANSVAWGTVGRGYVLYTANYLNWNKVAPLDPNPPNRLEVVKDVTYNVVDSTNNINIGLMRFDSSSAQGGYEGGSVRYPVFDVTESRNDFKSRLKTMSPRGYTPLAETLYENYLYWGGKDVLYGNKASPSNSTGVTLSGSGNKTYESPIKYSCQKNFNIYLSDGDATRDHSADDLIKTLAGVGSCDEASGNNCLNELAEYMHLNDIYDGLEGKQTVTTYTVGFDINHPLLRAAAEESGGKYYRANNAAELTQIFNKIIAEILSVNTTFSAPAVSINAFNRTTHRNELYFTLFKPSIGPHWNGNLKRFKLVFSDTGIPSIIDYKGNVAINKDTGFFDDGAYSWWTDISAKPDGGEVSKGGAAAHIGDAGINRVVYTYTGAGAPTNVSLAAGSAHQFIESNPAITSSMLNITGTDPIGFREKVIRWARGLDAFDDNGDGSTDDPRKIMADPLHSEPALIQYAGPDENPDITAYVATNDGVLHAIDTRDGTEKFSFIPKELLGMQRVVATDLSGNGKAYGIDGSVQALVLDKDKNGVIDTAVDKVYIFFGQRRGGNHYYAMDVTDRNNPILMWTIEGGVGDFAKLGQSWSNIQVKKIKLNTGEKYVAVFGGGYDIDQDSVTKRTPDDIGNAVYIVDALGSADPGGSTGTTAGSVLWWASSDAAADLILPEMKYSIPARLKAVDVSGDGYLDRMYVGDMGGQIWRFDIELGAALDAFVSGGRLADMAKDNSTADNRRFYYPPDVAFVSEAGKSPYLALAFSSGYRAHPLKRDNVDRIYMLRDMYLFDPPRNVAGDVEYPVAVTETEMFDATDNILGQGSDAEKATAITNLDAKAGWYVTLHEPSGAFVGEKGLAEALIIEGLMIVTTYIPQDRDSTSACEPADGVGRVYFMNLGDATPKYNFDKTVDSVDNLTAEDRYNTKVGGGLPPGAVPIFTKDGSAIIVGTETVQNPIDDTPKRMFWYEK